MAGKKNPFNSNVVTYKGMEGYSIVAGRELDKAAGYLEYKHVTVDRYELTEKDSFLEVLVVVHIAEIPDKRSAEWAAQLAVKNYHPSVYKPTVMAMDEDGGYVVYVRWPIWKNRAAPAEQPKEDLAF